MADFTFILKYFPKVLSKVLYKITFLLLYEKSIKISIE